MYMEDQTITLTDALTAENATVIVRRVDGSIGLCLSLETDGDIEIFFDRDDFQKLIAVLHLFRD